MSVSMFMFGGRVDVFKGERGITTEFIEVFTQTIDDPYKLKIPNMTCWGEVGFTDIVNLSELRHITIEGIKEDYFVNVKDVNKCVDSLRYYGYKVKVERAELYREQEDND